MTRARLLPLLLCAALVTAAPDHLAAGIAAKRAGQLAQAAAELRQAAADAPTNADAHWYLAWVLAGLKDSAGAVAAFRQVIALAPDTERANEAAAAILRLTPAPPLPPVAGPPPARPVDTRVVALLRGTVESVQTGSGQVVLKVQSLGVPGQPGQPLAGKATLLLGTFGRGPRLVGLVRQDGPLSLLTPGDVLEVGLGAPADGRWPLRALGRLDALGRAQPWAQVVGVRPLRLGESPVNDDPIVPMVFPTLGGATWRDSFLERRGPGAHLGQDLRAPRMRPLVAAFDGVVELFHATADHPANSLILLGDNGWQALYTHLNDDTPGTTDHSRDPFNAFAPGLANGARVTRGQLLGWNGASGDATGPHCHFELRDVGSGRVHNARASLNSAPILGTPTYDAVASAVRPAANEVRLDGYWLSVDPALGVGTLGLRSRTDRGGTTVVTQPTRRAVRFAGVTTRVLGAEATAVPAVGAYVIVLGHAEGDTLVASAVHQEMVGVYADAAVAQALGALR